MEHPVTAIKTLDDDVTESDLDSLSESFGIVDLPEGTDLNGENAWRRGGAGYQGRIKSLELHKTDAGANQVDGLRCRIGEIDNTPFHEGPAVVDAHVHGLAALEIVHPHMGAERQSAVCRREVVHVVDLAAGAETSMKRMAVPGGNALFTLDVFSRCCWGQRSLGGRCTTWHRMLPRFGGRPGWQRSLR